MLTKHLLTRIYITDFEFSLYLIADTQRETKQVSPGWLCPNQAHAQTALPVAVVPRALQLQQELAMEGVVVLAVDPGEAQKDKVAGMGISNVFVILFTK